MQEHSENLNVAPPSPLGGVLPLGVKSGHPQADLGEPPNVRRLRIVAAAGNIESPSFQQVVRAFVEPLSRRGIDVTCELLPPGGGERKALLERVGRYDALWLHRALMPPWRLSRWRRIARRIVFSFDDPIMYSTHGRGIARRIKFAWTLRRCDGAIVASEYLAAIARRYCPRVSIFPMAIDLPRGMGVSPMSTTGILPVSSSLSSKKSEETAHGQDAHATGELLWLGSKSTQRYLRELSPALAEVGRLRPNARLRVVGHEEFTADPLNVDFRRWSPREQELALGECDIGLCPMPDTPWTRGKCPYKVLQYMAAGMAWVGSAVGENLVSAGAENDPDPRGLCAGTDEQWVRALTRLIDDAALRRAMGASGLQYVRRVHEREMLTDRLAEILRGVVGEPGERVL